MHHRRALSLDPARRRTRAPKPAAESRVRDRRLPNSATPNPDPAVHINLDSGRTVLSTDLGSVVLIPLGLAPHEGSGVSLPG